MNTLILSFYLSGVIDLLLLQTIWAYGSDPKADSDDWLLENPAIKVTVHHVQTALGAWRKMEDSFSQWDFLLPAWACLESVSESRYLTLLGGWPCA